MVKRKEALRDLVSIYLYVVYACIKHYYTFYHLQPHANAKEFQAHLIYAVLEFMIILCIITLITN